METGRFTWQQHGPKDYAETCKVLAMNTAEAKGELNGSERSALEHILHLFSTAARTRGHNGWLTFSRTWLSGVLRLSIRQVGRILRKLRALGYIERVRRHPVDFQPQSSLTKCGHRLLSLLYRVSNPGHRRADRRRQAKEQTHIGQSAQKPQQIHIGTKTAHNDLKKGIEAPGRGVVASYSPSQIEDCAPLSAEATLRGFADLRASLVEKIGGGWEADKKAKEIAEITRRRAELDRQKEILRRRGDL